MKVNRRQEDGGSLRFSASTATYVVFQIFWSEFRPTFLELTGSAYPKVRWSARRALRSRGGVGRFERGLVSRRACEAEKRDGEVRFSVRPCLPELELSALSFILLRRLFPWNTGV